MAARRVRVVLKFKSKCAGGDAALCFDLGGGEKPCAEAGMQGGAPAFFCGGLARSTVRNTFSFFRISPPLSFTIS